VLVVEGGGSMRCALLGDQLAAMAVDNGWAGVIVNGCIRDSADIGAMPLGVKALATFPLKSSKRDLGLRDVPVLVAGVLVNPGVCVPPPPRGCVYTLSDPNLGLNPNAQRHRFEMKAVSRRGTASKTDETTLSWPHNRARSHASCAELPHNRTLTCGWWVPW